MAAYLVILHHGRDVCCWHLANNPTAPAFVRYWGHSGQWRTLARDGLSANDPKRTKAPPSRLASRTLLRLISTSRQAGDHTVNPALSAQRRRKRACQSGRTGLVRHTYNAQTETGRNQSSTSLLRGGSYLLSGAVRCFSVRPERRNCSRVQAPRAPQRGIP
jgi:hypothetical protein